MYITAFLVRRWLALHSLFHRFFMVLALGLAYVRFGGLAWMQAVFYGVGAAVIGIIAISAKKINRQKCLQGQLAPCDLPVNGRPYGEHLIGDCVAFCGFWSRCMVLARTAEMAA